MTLDTRDSFYPPTSDEGTPLPVHVEPYQKLTNRQFAHLSPAKKRVAIARDVLAWLDESKLVPSPGNYIMVLEDAKAGKGYQYGVDRVNGFECRACALGALFACAVEKRPGFNLQSVDVWPYGARHLLAPYFEELQLRAIETAFEMNSSFMGDRDPALTARAVRFGEAIHSAVPRPEFGSSFDWDAYYAESARRRMRAIMQNIIDNNGTFIP